MKGLIGGPAFLLLIPLWWRMWTKSVKKEGVYIYFPLVLVTAAMLCFLDMFVSSLMVCLGVK